jgi:hypothetical protein
LDGGTEEVSISGVFHSEWLNLSMLKRFIFFDTTGQGIIHAWRRVAGKNPCAPQRLGDPGFHPGGPGKRPEGVF